MPRSPTLLGISALLAALAATSGAHADTAPAPGGVVAVEQVAPVPPSDAVPPAAPDAPEPAPLFKRRGFVGVWGGIGFANVVHPQLSTPHVYGPLLALQIGYNASSRWAFGLEVTNLDRSVSRTTVAQRFGVSSSFIHTLANCAACQSPPLGGQIVDTTLILDSVGPRVDFTPFGPQGLYLGAAGGVAVVGLLDTRVGGSGSARAGLRLTLADVVDVGIESGVQGQAFTGGSSLMGYGAATVKLAIDASTKGRGPGTYVVPMRSHPVSVSP